MFLVSESSLPLWLEVRCALTGLLDEFGVCPLGMEVERSVVATEGMRADPARVIGQSARLHKIDASGDARSWQECSAKRGDRNGTESSSRSKQTSE